MLDAIGYLVDNGIKWRAMPADFPPWDRVYAFFGRWRDRGLIREFHDRVRGQGRERAGHDALPTARMIDSQSVKADAVVGARTRGFDGGKLVNGRKRQVVVDTLGLLLGVMVTAADVGDRAAAHTALREAVRATILSGRRPACTAVLNPDCDPAPEGRRPVSAPLEYPHTQWAGLNWFGPEKAEDPLGDRRRRGDRVHRHHGPAPPPRRQAPLRPSARGGVELCAPPVGERHSGSLELGSAGGRSDRHVT